MSKLMQALLIAGSVATAMPALASNHREAPITALDHKADITDSMRSAATRPVRRPRSR